jgi:hypothetical protein
MPSNNYLHLLDCLFKFYLDHKFMFNNYIRQNVSNETFMKLLNSNWGHLDFRWTTSEEIHVI